MVERQCRHFAHADQLGRFHPAVPSDDLAVARHKDRVGEPEPADAFRNLANLLLAVGAGIAGIAEISPPN
jgi:hypothetical protein